MNAIRNVFSAFANLAASINGLAAVVDAVSAKVRVAVALEEMPPALPGEVIDGTVPGDTVPTVPGDTVGTTKRARKAS